MSTHVVFLLLPFWLSSPFFWQELSKQLGGSQLLAEVNSAQSPKGFFRL